MKLGSLMGLAAGWWLLLSGMAVVLADERGDYIRRHYSKFEVSIPMRDGKQLFTAIYTPNTTDASKTYPILMVRTPYSVGPYGVNQYKTVLGPSPEFEKSGYIFVFQDVRGRYMSEGEFDNMRPHIDHKSADSQIDESSDTYDTIEWLLENLPGHNGRVGQWGISYPGFYTSAGAIDSHPALKAVSPQAPIADWFFDDFHRNGAFVLPMGFNFFSSFGRSRPSPTAMQNERFEHGTRDGYQFFLDLGPLKNVNEKYFNNSIAFWNDMAAHPNYDPFWQDRNLLPHLKNISASVLVVGGWFDTEDLYGPLETYRAIEKLNPGIENRLVMGPWYHGQWNRDDGAKLGDASFGFATAQWFRDEVQFPFFESLLKDAPARSLAEATVFETGANRWRQFDSWPPAAARPITFHFAAESSLKPESATTERPSAVAGYDEYISDPAKPVPYTLEITPNWARNYVTEDQRFAAWRPDVLVYRSQVLEQDFTIAGPTEVELWVSTSAGDADWVVKIIDQYPGAPPVGGSRSNDPGAELYPSHRQQLVRAGVLRGRFRESFAEPKPFEPNTPTKITLRLDDCFHTFAAGHQLMIQVQSSWFPFIDRNPQKYVPNIFEAGEDDFIKATHRLHYSGEFPSRVQFLKL
jgi:uncharacterized protein